MKHRYQKPLFGIGPLLLAAAIVLGSIGLLQSSVARARAAKSSATVTASARATAKANVTIQAGSVLPPPVELVTIAPTGFEPGQLTRPAGKFVLEVDNRSGVDEVELRFDRQEGGRVVTATVSNTAPDWQTELDLAPGVYLLSEANHAGWICRITITAN